MPHKIMRTPQPFASLMVLFLLSLSCSMASAEPAKFLLGIPFGGKLSMKICPFDTEKTKLPCWVGSPFVYKPTGEKIGSIHLPNPKGRPQWAANAMFKVTLDRQDRVQVIEVEKFNEDDMHDIASSISRRFGLPESSHLNRIDARWATWKSQEGYAMIQCKGKCWVTFRTPSAQQAHEEGVRNSARADALRPKAP